MRYALTCDFGSTFTKVRVVSLDDGALVASSQSPTTASTDLRLGLQRAVDLAGPAYSLDGAHHLAGCSSAAGGLRMVAVGLVPSLTVSAAREAALGAGARLVGTFSHRLTDGDVAAIDQLGCDLILLAGGTDGGDSDVVLHNAERLAQRRIGAAVIYAGNREVTQAATASLSAAGVLTVAVPNVLPNLRELDLEPARVAIRELFLRHIVSAKGMELAADALGGTLVPTPLAVLDAAVLMSGGVATDRGVGDLMVVDVGGATTDVHSVAAGSPVQPGTVWQGIPEPHAKRTVEGDLGLRVNAGGIVDTLTSSLRFHPELEGADEAALTAYADRVSSRTELLPSGRSESTFDRTLATTAVDVAVGRHVGRIRRSFSPHGEVLVQTGKDLSNVQAVVGTGGLFAHQDAGIDVLRRSLARPELEGELRPVDADLLVDREYVMAAGGLLSSTHPEVALALLRTTQRSGLVGKELG